MDIRWFNDSEENSDVLHFRIYNVTGIIDEVKDFDQGWT